MKFYSYTTFRKSVKNFDKLTYLNIYLNIVNK